MWGILTLSYWNLAARILTLAAPNPIANAPSNQRRMRKYNVVITFDENKNA
jgi:hypothetical protein